MRIKRKHLELAESVSWPGRRCYGYSAGGLAVETEAAIICELTGRLLHGEGLNALARELNERGIPTLTVASWRAATIETLMKAPRLAGLRTHHGVVVAQGRWEPIISARDSELLRARFAPGRSAGSRGGGRRHLLSGLLKCGKCESPMVRGFARKTRVPNYRFPKNVGSAACGRLSIVAIATEEFSRDAACFALDTFVEPYASADKNLNELDRLTQRKLDLAADFGRGDITRDEWSAARHALEERIRLITPIAPAKPTHSRSTGAELAENWPDMAVSTRRAVLEDLFIGVTVTPRNITKRAKVFDASRLIPEWRC